MTLSYCMNPAHLLGKLVENKSSAGTTGCADWLKRRLHLFRYAVYESRSGSSLLTPVLNRLGEAAKPEESSPHFYEPRGVVSVVSLSVLAYD